MAARGVPQPSPERIVAPTARPLVVGVVPGQSAVVALTSAAWADALGGVPLYFGYADPARIVEREYPDGSVRHADLDPDLADDSWQEVERSLRRQLADTLVGRVGWEFRYLAGRADRALTHLARAVDASAIVVGARRPSSGERVREFLDSAVGVQLSRHQHRPVLVVPQAVVDWKAPVSW